jgi:8-amino-7-oxononanoate synthase
MAGQGTFSHQQQTVGDQVLRVGTLGKAFASSGAFIAGSQWLIESIMQFARPYIYTTAQPPYQASFSRAALARVIQADEQRAHLRTLINYLQQAAKTLNLPLMPSDTPIQPLFIGCSELAMRWQQQLWQQGIWVPAIRPPTVPIGTARLRISLSAAHSVSDLDRLLSTLVACQNNHPS